jgi:hypothetical protein
MFCRSLFVLLYFSFGHCVVCSSSIYGFWLPPFDIYKLFLQSTLLCFLVLVITYLSSPPVFSACGLCYTIFSFICMFCRSLFVLFIWPLCCLFFFDVRILITPLVCSNSSKVYIHSVNGTRKLLSFHPNI